MRVCVGGEAVTSGRRRHRRRLAALAALREGALVKRKYNKCTHSQACSYQVSHHNTMMTAVYVQSGGWRHNDHHSWGKPILELDIPSLCTKFAPNAHAHVFMLYGKNNFPLIRRGYSRQCVEHVMRATKGKGVWNRTHTRTYFVRG